MVLKRLLVDISGCIKKIMKTKVEVYRVSNKNHKIVSMPKPNISVVGSEENQSMSQEELDAFLNETPTRGEVMNFVDGYMNEQVIPFLINLNNDRINKLNGMISICQAILIDSGIITQEGLTQLQEKWEAEYEKKKEEHAAKATRAIQRAGEPTDVVK